MGKLIKNHDRSLQKACAKVPLYNLTANTNVSLYNLTKNCRIKLDHNS